jgi:diguanylate cyclase (GGDEF)-like protein
MDTEYGDILNSPKIIENYSFLEEIGIIRYINTLHSTIRRQESLLDEIIQIYDKQSNKELTDYLISRLVHTFIPEKLVFMFQPEQEETLEIICYEKLKPAKIQLNISSLDPFREFFAQYPNTLDFSLFEYRFPDESVVETMRSLSPEVIVPLMGMKGLYGVIIFGKKIMGKDYTPDEIVYLDRLMRFTAIWLQNNVHYKSSILDSKTKIFNHAYFIDRLTESLVRFRRYGTTVSLIICDVDHFKNFNDTYGHLAGDMALISLAQVLKASVREVEVVARYGGEEFVVLLTNHELKQAMEVAERIRSRVEKMDIKFQDAILKITISIGLAHAVPGMTETKDLIRQADEALYRSKEGGRNRVTLYQQDRPPPNPVPPDAAGPPEEFL